ncbi:peptidase inhibitor family I36 protein [Kitasatospora viridis]
MLAAAPASATVVTGNTCPTDWSVDDACLTLFYNSDFGGAYLDFSHSGADSGIYNLANYTFVNNGGAGSGQSVKNNAASAQGEFYGSGYSATIFYNSGYGGACETLMAGQNAGAVQVPRLGATYNNDASVYFYETGTVPPRCHTYLS